MNTLRQHRQQAGLTQSQIASIANVSTRQYQRYESGRITPPITTACIIARALQSSLDALYPIQEKGA